PAVNLIPPGAITRHSIRSEPQGATVWCREPEVRAASAFANFGFKSGTRIIELLVSLCFRSSHSRPPQGCANCGIGTLVRYQLAQHVMQNAAVLEVIELVEGVDPAGERNALEATIGGDNLGDHTLARLDLPVQPADRYLLIAPETERLP